MVVKYFRSGTWWGKISPTRQVGLALCQVVHACAYALIFLMTVWMQQNLFYQTVERFVYLKSPEVHILFCYNFPSNIRGRNIKKVIWIFFFFLRFSLLVYGKMRRQSANEPFSLASHYSVGFFLHRRTYLHTYMYLFHRNI